MIEQSLPGQSNTDSTAPETPFIFKDELEVFRQLNNEHATEVTAVAVRRILRDNQKNVDELRKAGKLLPDETIIPDRTIEQNVNANSVSYVNFVEQPTTVISFLDPQNPDVDFSTPARFVTDLIRYKGWQEAWHKVIDCMVVHGAGFLEVRLAPDNPGRFANEYVRREDLIIPLKTKAIKHCSRVGRRYEITKQQLKDFAKQHSFNSAIVKKLEEHYKSKTEAVEIFKYFMLDDQGKVSVAWLAPESIAPDSWLRKPEPLYIGDFDEKANPLQATHIPIYAFIYSVKEDEEILSVQGEAALSVHAQEALTGLLSATVNSAVRAAGLYAGRATRPGADPQDKELYPLKSGYVHDGDITFFSLPWPNPVALTVAQSLSVRNAQQSGQTDFAAMSRQDTAKRATEIVAAREESDKLKSKRIATFSRQCLALAECHWNIILNQIKIRGIKLPGQEPLPGQPVDPTYALYGGILSPTTHILMSADTQVVAREQRKNQLAQIYPTTVGSAYQEPVFISLLTELFPADMPRWTAEVNAKMAQQQQTAQLLNGAFQMMMAVPPAATAQIPNYDQVLNALQQAIQPPQQDGPKPNQPQVPQAPAVA